jgi:hypothetical protein
VSAVVNEKGPHLSPLAVYKREREERGTKKKEMNIDFH